MDRDGLYATIDALKGTKTPKGKLAFMSSRDPARDLGSDG